MQKSKVRRQEDACAVLEVAANGIFVTIGDDDRKSIKSKSHNLI